jgi:hypothetical protein
VLAFAVALATTVNKMLMNISNSGGQWMMLYFKDAGPGKWLHEKIKKL